MFVVFLDGKNYHVYVCWGGCYMVGRKVGRKGWRQGRKVGRRRMGKSKII